MAGVTTRCKQCDGRRFTPDVLQHRLHGLAIDQVLRLDVATAAEVFTAAKPAAILRRLIEVGLPYITLGQPLTTLSGGERQRLKVAAAMTTPAATYVLDEPSSSLHLAAPTPWSPCSTNSSTPGARSSSSSTTSP